MTMNIEEAREHLLYLRDFMGMKYSEAWSRMVLHGHVAPTTSIEEVLGKPLHYPYKRGDRVMVGITTWQHPMRHDPVLDQMRAAGASLGELADREREVGPVYGPDGPFCRYFKAATVVANDREANVLVIDSDEPYAGGQTIDVMVWAREDGGWEGDEIVAYDESLPQNAKDAHARALRGEVF